MTSQAEKTVSELLFEIGITHKRSKISGLQVLLTQTSVGPVAIDELDAHDAALLHLHALSAA